MRAFFEDALRDYVVDTFQHVAGALVQLDERQVIFQVICR
jgi:hypothetical protein